MILALCACKCTVAESPNFEPEMLDLDENSENAINEAIELGMRYNPPPVNPNYSVKLKKCHAGSKCNYGQYSYYCGETRTLTSMHVYHSRLSFASLTLLLFWLIVNSSAATRYIGDPDVPIPQQDVLRRSTNRLYR